MGDIVWCILLSIKYHTNPVQFLKFSERIFSFSGVPVIKRKYIIHRARRKAKDLVLRREVDDPEKESTEHKMLRSQFKNQELLLQYIAE